MQDCKNARRSFRCYTQAPDLPSLERNIQEAIQAYLKVMEVEKPLPNFVGTWRVEVAM